MSRVTGPKKTIHVLRSHKPLHNAGFSYYDTLAVFVNANLPSLVQCLHSVTQRGAAAPSRTHYCPGEVT